MYACFLFFFCTMSCRWVDGKSPHTCARIRLLDLGKIVFPTGMSNVHRYIDFLGGEHMLPKVCNVLIYVLCMHVIDFSGPRICC